MLKIHRVNARKNRKNSCQDEVIQDFNDSLKNEQIKAEDIESKYDLLHINNFEKKLAFMNKVKSIAS